jgi:hypothetical protein
MVTPSSSTDLALRNRRRFLQFLAGSPLLASLPAIAWQKEQAPGGLASPKDALNVMDFEEFSLAMRQCGARSIAEITRSSVI